MKTRLDGKGRGDVVTFSGMRCRIAVSGEETEGRLTVIEMTVEAGAGAPLHVSGGEDKYFLVLRGRFQVRAAGEVRTAGEGDTITVARGAVHGFRNVGEGPGVLLLVSSPAGHDRFFRDMAMLPVPHDPAVVMEVCRRHGQELVG